MGHQRSRVQSPGGPPGANEPKANDADGGEAATIQGRSPAKNPTIRAVRWRVRNSWWATNAGRLESDGGPPEANEPKANDADGRAVRRMRDRGNPAAKNPTSRKKWNTSELPIIVTPDQIPPIQKLTFSYTIVPRDKRGKVNRL